MITGGLSFALLGVFFAILVYFAEKERAFKSLIAITLLCVLIPLFITWYAMIEQAMLYFQ